MNLTGRLLRIYLFYFPETHFRGVIKQLIVLISIITELVPLNTRTEHSQFDVPSMDIQNLHKLTIGCCYR